MRRAGAATGTAAAFATVLLAASPAPARADTPGWRPVFSAEFNGTSLPGECWAYDGPHGGPPTSYYRPDEVNVGGGMLRLSMHRRDYGGRQYTTGGMGCFKVTQLYGKYEYRAKVPPGAGIDSYSTVFADGQATFIETLAKPGDEKMYLTNEYSGGASHQNVSGSYSNDFHTYTIEWTPAGERFLVDGQPTWNDPHSSNKTKWIGFAMSCGDNLTGLPDAQTQLPAEFLVDWLHVYAYQPGAPTKAPSAGTTPSRSAAASASASAAASGAPSGTDSSSSDVVAGIARPAARSEPAGPSPLWWALAAGALLTAFGAGYLYVRRRRTAGRHS